MEMFDLNDNKNAKGLHIAHLSVCSLVNKWGNIKANFLDSGIHVYPFLNPGYLVICLNLRNDYSLIRNDRSWNYDDNNSLPPKKVGGL